MPVDSIVQRFGDLHFPVDDTAVSTTLVSLDPAKARLLDLFKTAINYEFTTAWQKVVGSALGTTGFGASHPLYGKSPVDSTLELMPSHKIMLERRAEMPILCLYRMGESTVDQKTLFRDQITCHWGLDYVLGPMTVADARRVGDICIGIVKLVRLIIRQRGHKSYDSGALQFFPDKGGLASIDLKSYTFGQAQFAGDEDGTMYHALSMTLETTEIGYDLETEWGSFDGIDYTIGVGNGDEVLPDVIEASSDVPVAVG